MMIFFRAVILLIAFCYGSIFATFAVYLVGGLLGVFGVIDKPTLNQLEPYTWFIGSGFVILYIAFDNFTPLGRWRMRIGLGARPPSARERTALDAILAGLGKAYMKRHGKPLGRINLYVTDSLEPNAMAFGANNIAVSRGLIKPALEDAAESRAMLEGVMAHELGHIYAKDTLFSGVVHASLYATDIGIFVLAVCFSPLILISFISSSLSGYLMAAARNITTFLVSLPAWVIAIVSRATAAPAEYRADRFAAELAGPGGLIRFFDLIAPLDTRIGSGVIGHYMRSHPPTELRRDKMEQLAENER